jgi:hypothetical protein
MKWDNNNERHSHNIPERNYGVPWELNYTSKGFLAIAQAAGRGELIEHQIALIERHRRILRAQHQDFIAITNKRGVG